MFVLDLTDPLWLKLDDAHRDRDIPEALCGLSKNWDDTLANTIFWDNLCHQDTCYGATYAAFPHLLRMAQNASCVNIQHEITLFLARVAMIARIECETAADGLPVLQGLPLDLNSWDRKLDIYRQLVDSTGWKWRADKSTKRYKELLARPAIDAEDLEKVALIRAHFFDTMPPLAELCTSLYRASDLTADAPFILAGVIAAQGDSRLAQIVASGESGGFSCNNCGWGYEYIRFGPRFACYADATPPGTVQAVSADDDRALQDYDENSPNNADGFITPCEKFAPNSAADIALRLADEKNDTDTAQLIKLCAGQYICNQCQGATAIY